MSDQVAVVTDSTAYLPRSLAEEHGIRVVPVQVVIGGTTYSEGIDVDPAAVVAALREWRPVTTSRPTPQAFAETYAEAVAAGATSIVSVHLSSKMSGTYESAAIAAREVGIPVTVIDSGLIGMAMGFATIAAAEAAASGCDADAVARVARARPVGVVAVLRRHPGVPQTRGTDRTSDRSAGRRAGRETVATAGGRGDRALGEGPYVHPGDRPPRGARRRAGRRL